jgi:hypothetical protein
MTVRSNAVLLDIFGGVQDAATLSAAHRNYRQGLRRRVCNPL